jgi:hypothetical protein
MSVSERPNLTLQRFGLLIGVLRSIPGKARWSAFRSFLSRQLYARLEHYFLDFSVKWVILLTKGRELSRSFGKLCRIFCLKSRFEGHSAIGSV